MHAKLNLVRRSADASTRRSIDASTHRDVDASITVNASIRRHNEAWTHPCFDKEFNLGMQFVRYVLGIAITIIS